MNAILRSLQSRSGHMLPDALHMQMTADIKRHLVLFQQRRHLRPVFHLTLGCEQSAFLKQVVVRQHNYLNTMLLRHPQMGFHPPQCRIADPALHMVPVIVDAGIHHQQPVGRI